MCIIYTVVLYVLTCQNTVYVTLFTYLVYICCVEFYFNYFKNNFSLILWINRKDYKVFLYSENLCRVLQTRNFVTKAEGQSRADLVRVRPRKQKTKLTYRRYTWISGGQYCKIIMYNNNIYIHVRVFKLSFVVTTRFVVINILGLDFYLYYSIII